MGDRKWNGFKSKQKQSSKLHKSYVKERIRFYFGDQLILKASRFKYFGIIICSDLNWTDHVNYTVRNAWKALHFMMRVQKKGNNNTKRLAYTAVVRQTDTWVWSGVLGPYREGQVSALNGVQQGAAKFGNKKNDSDWETLALRRLIARICALLKAHTVRQAWETIIIV